MDHWNGRAPEALAAYSPVLEPVLDRAVAGTGGFESGGDCVLGLVASEPVESVATGIHHRAVPLEGLAQRGCRVVACPLDQYSPDLDAVPLSEVVVSLVVARHSHHSAGAVGGDDEVASVYRHLLSVQGVDRVAA